LSVCKIVKKYPHYERIFPGIYETMSPVDEKGRDDDEIFIGYP